MSNVIRQRFFVVLVVLVIMTVFFAVTQEQFLTGGNISAILPSWTGASTCSIRKKEACSASFRSPLMSCADTS